MSPKNEPAPVPQDDLQLPFNQLRALIDHIPDLVYMKDTASRFVAANLAMAKQFNLDSPEGLIGKTDFEFCPVNLAQEYFDDEQKLFATGNALISKEEAGVDTEGRPAVFMVTKSPIRDAHGKVVGLVGIGKNITEYAKAKQKLAKRNQQIENEREQLQTLIDNIPDFIFFKDRQSRYLNGNNKFFQGLNARSLDEIIGKQDFDYFEKAVAQKFFEDESRLFETGERISQEEISQDAKGRKIHLHTTKTPIVDLRTQQIVGLVGISRNITEIKTAREELQARADELDRQKNALTNTLNQLKKAQSQLVQSEKMASLGVLTAGIAHEINNPINFVYAGVNSMVKDFDDVKQVIDKLKELPIATDPAAAIAEIESVRQNVGFDEAFEALEETLKDIKLGATRITEIVAGLSKFSRMGNENWQTSKLHEDIESVLILLKNKYKTHIRIERDFAPDMPAIECFPSKLNQAIMNIVSNAIDAIDTHASAGTVTIATRHDENSAYISISDDGHGMDEKVRTKIFDPFFTTKGIGKGTGLGLAITYSIIQDHKGQLHLTTEPNKGSTFVIELPIRHIAP